MTNTMRAFTLMALVAMSGCGVKHGSEAVAIPGEDGVQIRLKNLTYFRMTCDGRFLRNSKGVREVIFADSRDLQLEVFRLLRGAGAIVLDKSDSYLDHSLGGLRSKSTGLEGTSFSIDEVRVIGKRAEVRCSFYTGMEGAADYVFTFEWNGTEWVYKDGVTLRIS